METEYLTKEKHEELTKEIEFLKNTKRKEVAEQLEYSKSLGDLSENAEYHEARDAQAVLEDRIMKIENIIKNAVIVSSHHKDIVSVGSIVTVQKRGSNDEKEYTLVGAEESDISVGKISVKSPLGEAVMGKKSGDTFSFDAPSGPVAYKVIGIK